MRDYVTGGLVTPMGAGTRYGTNRYGHLQSSLDTNGGYYSAASNFYFGGDFSISVWVNPTSLNQNGRIIDCGTSSSADNVILGYSHQLTGRPFVGIYNQTSGNLNMVSSVAIPILKWTHLVATLNKNLLSLYINGSWVQEWTVDYVPRRVTRSNCWFGWSSLGSVNLAYVMLDQIKVYNRALSRNEVWNDYQAIWV